MIQIGNQLVHGTAGEPGRRTIGSGTKAVGDPHLAVTDVHRVEESPHVDRAAAAPGTTLHEVATDCIVEDRAQRGVKVLQLHLAHRGVRQ
jgi:hypothetical protein